MSIVLWSLVFLVVYTYFGYPLLLAFCAVLARSRIRKAEILPRVSVIIAAHNEERHIRRKVWDTLSLDYPKERLEVIVVSDGSTDNTVVEASVGGRRVKVLQFAERKGKTFAQNLAVKAAGGEIIVFTDATTAIEPGAVRALVRGFADPDVGAVAGELVYLNNAASRAGDGGGLYWKYEKAIKRLESRVCSLIGVSGCFYAVRKRYYDDIPSDLISDFVIAQMLYRKGKRTVYEPEARSYEETSARFAEEFSMRARVAVRSLYGLWRMRGLLNPLRGGFYSIELLSHKVLRYLIPVFLAAVLMINMIMVAQDGGRAGLAYTLLLGLQMLFYFAAFAGWLLKGKRYISLPFYFLVTNAALLVGFVRFLRGEKQVTWKPVRR